jgi:hypothetical protein
LNIRLPRFWVLVAGKKSEKDGMLDAQDVEIKEEVGVSASARPFESPVV